MKYLIILILVIPILYADICDIQCIYTGVLTIPYNITISTIYNPDVTQVYTTKSSTIFNMTYTTDYCNETLVKETTVIFDYHHMELGEDDVTTITTVSFYLHTNITLTSANFIIVLCDDQNQKIPATGLMLLAVIPIIRKFKK